MTGIENITNATATTVTLSRCWRRHNIDNTATNSNGTLVLTATSLTTHDNYSRAIGALVTKTATMTD